MKFDNVMMSNGFKINEYDKCVYAKSTSNGYVTVFLYVDDMLIIGSYINIIKITKKMLINNFDMKDTGVADVILGIKISKMSDRLVLSQSHYVEKILNKYEDSPAKTLVDVNQYLVKNIG